MVRECPDCSGTISFSPSPLACHFEAHMHFRGSEMLRYMALSAPEAKKSLNILMAGNVERTALSCTHKKILGKFGKKKFLTMLPSWNLS